MGRMCPKPRSLSRRPTAEPSELITWLSWHAQHQPDQTALWFHDGSEFTTRTWRQIAHDVHRAAAVFASLGIEPGNRVVQMAENRYEWLTVDLALLSLGAVHVPLHVNLPPWQAANQVRRADSTWFLVSTAALGQAVHRELLALHQAENHAERASAGQPAPHTIVYSADLTTDVAPAEPHVEWKAFPELLAAADPDQGAREMARVAPQIREDSPATILFTSGTLSEPKGVVLTHGNLAANVRGIREAFHERPSERRMCVLPLSHIYARVCDLYAWLMSGGELALARRPDTLLTDCQAFRPTFLNGVPYLFDRIRRKWLADGATAGGATADGATAGVSIRDLLGGRIEVCVCGGAALADDVYDFYHEHGVPLLPGYGLTEASPVVTASTLSSVRRGCVGRPIPGVEVRIAPDGEILTRGPHVTPGYWRDAESTAAAIVEGWLRTGDLGEWDVDGLLRIVGRKKELIVLSTGKNVAPAPLEALLASDPWIAQAAVFGEGRSHLVGLVAPQPEVLPRIAAGLGLSNRPLEDLIQSPALHEVFALRVARLNERLAPHEQIRRFALIARPFSLDRDEVTAKLTLRRAVIERHFAELIGTLYDERCEESQS